MYLNKLFLFLNEIDISNFADDTTASVYQKNLAELLEKLERNSWISHPLGWNDYMKWSSDKCLLFISGHKYEHQWAQIGKDMVWEEIKVKLLGTTTENELKFGSNILNIFSKANNKIKCFKYLNISAAKDTL